MRGNVTGQHFFGWSSPWEGVLMEILLLHGGRIPQTPSAKRDEPKLLHGTFLAG